MLVTECFKCKVWLDMPGERGAQTIVCRLFSFYFKINSWCWEGGKEPPCEMIWSRRTCLGGRPPPYSFCPVYSFCTLLGLLFIFLNFEGAIHLSDCNLAFALETYEDSGYFNLISLKRRVRKKNILQKSDFVIVYEKQYNCLVREILPVEM